MATNEQQIEGAATEAANEGSLHKSVVKESAGQIIEENSGDDHEQVQDITAGKKKENDEELEEGELIDDDDDDDEDDDDDDDNDDNNNTSNNNNNNNNSSQEDSKATHGGANHSRSGNMMKDSHGVAVPINASGSGSAANLETGGMGPMGPGLVQKYNARCKFYHKIEKLNKCTWGPHCRFEHHDGSPEPNEPFDLQGLPGPPHPSIPVRRPAGPTLPPMGPAERPYPPYANRNQPYPMVPHGYGPYDMYGPQMHHQSPPLPPHFMQPHNWRHQQGLMYHPSPPGPGHPQFEPLSPSHPSNAIPGPSSHDSPPQANPLPAVAGGPPTGGPPQHSYPATSSPASSAMYERKHRLAYELAPWNDPSSSYPPGKFDRGDPSGGYPQPPPGSRGIYYRKHYNRDPYGRDHPGPMPYHIPNAGPPHPSYPPGYPPNYPSNYASRGGPMGPHPSQYRYMSSSHRNMPPESGRSRSNKRGHDGGDSSWSDSGSEDSILGQPRYNNKTHSSSKSNKKPHHQHMQAQQPNHHLSQHQQETSTAALSSDDTNLNDYSNLDQGSGTPPGEPLPEDKERQEMLLNKLKEIEDLMAKKKGEQEQEDPI